ncbi:hypothetical protein BABINDRAFT_42269 [Babjeviella inositovora NRRL Y-12698]|uniref:Importin-95 n=1 Tax=Babjeviella inositovora NRRL Y-12698 TaxID=984486 RepID=A0A1E3QHG7_9ASCO|nr:uncharacterized protein BABINDRAFT_42269 [Babjeviella inositovora NRRL Y-12698]ODQ77139.1 hypothetical protein BABINDRAFT_42269 [Babjeviella inositovora NRRL Y-12698]
MNISQILENTFNPTQRAEAEAQLEAAAKDHFVAYLGLLTECLATATQRTDVRMLAALCLKNQLTAKDVVTQQAYTERWIALDTGAKQQIKETALGALLAPETPVANAAASLVAAIAAIELPRTEWPELIPMIVENTKTEQPVNVKRASLLTIGYICEAADPSDPGIAAQANGILIAIVQGAQALEPSRVVRLTALNALVNSLEFIRLNFEKEGERNYIMQVVCEATQAEDTDIQESAFGALARIMALYYVYMRVYMEKALYGLTVSGMQSTDEKVACMAVEFWSTVCEVELDLTFQVQDYGAADYDNYNFALVAIQDVLPTMLALLTRQNDDAEDDDWSVAMAAGACLQLFAQNTGNYVVQPALAFVESKIQAQEWRDREAAVMAFGSILDGPDHEQLKTLITQALPPILSLISDPVLQVKETVAWCLGRIADLVVDAIDVQTHLPHLMTALVQGMQDHPKVSTNCCWTLMNLLEQLQPEGAQEETGVLSQYYETCVQVLVTVSGRADNEHAARASAYEALSAFVLYAANDTTQIVNGVATEALSRLEATIAMVASVSSIDDKRNLEELQTNILALLTNVIRRVDQGVVPVADQLMTLFLKLLATEEQKQQGETSLVEEDVFLALSALASATGAGFAKYFDAFLPYLTRALENTEVPTCNTAVRLVADVSSSMGEAILPYVGGLMNILGANLSNVTVRRELRPIILSCFGDVATSIGTHFTPYLEVVMNICHQAGAMEPEDASPETIDYVYTVREAVLDAYVGVVAGLADQAEALSHYMANIFGFLESLAKDASLMTTDNVARSVVGLIGDLAVMYPDGRIKQAYAQEWVSEVIRKTRSNPQFYQATRDTARWAREQQKKQLLM